MPIPEDIAPPPDATGADAKLTAERDELKYLIAPEYVSQFSGSMGMHLPHHRFTGEGANRLPNPQHFVTTIYFDTPSRHQYRAVVADRTRNAKIRAKEYYDLHPSLAELATDPRQIVKYQPSLWLELKIREGTRTRKRRIGIPKADVPDFFAHGVITPEMVELQRPLHGLDGESILEEIAAHCRRFGEPLRADMLVNYRRLPWQDLDGNVRVTMDVGLEYYAPPADLWQRRYGLVRETLGPPCGRQPGAIVEVKVLDKVPGWMDELLGEVKAQRSTFSKFTEASQAVHA